MKVTEEVMAGEPRVVLAIPKEYVATSKQEDTVLLVLPVGYAEPLAALMAESVAEIKEFVRQRIVKLSDNI